MRWGLMQRFLKLDLILSKFILQSDRNASAFNDNRSSKVSNWSGELSTKYWNGCPHKVKSAAEQFLLRWRIGLCFDLYAYAECQFGLHGATHWVCTLFEVGAVDLVKSLKISKIAQPDGGFNDLIH